MNPNSILFLYEGDTEKEFYDKLFLDSLNVRSIRITKSNLHGIWNINRKVQKKIISFLADKKSVGQNNITVIVAHDREGGPTTESMLNISILKKEFCSGKSRIADIWEVIATQDIESWLFQDINGLYDFLKVPKKKRNYDKFKDTESLNNVTLSTLFREQGKLYMKGKKFAGLIAKLDIKKIIANTPELRELLELIKSLCL